MKVFLTIFIYNGRIWIRTNNDVSGRSKNIRIRVHNPGFIISSYPGRTVSTYACKKFLLTTREPYGWRQNNKVSVLDAKWEKYIIIILLRPSFGLICRKAVDHNVAEVQRIFIEAGLANLQLTEAALSEQPTTWLSSLAVPFCRSQNLPAPGHNGRGSTEQGTDSN
jgi:hypothetical protein